MTVTIGLGWWVLPLFVTIIAFVVAILMSRNDTPDPYGAGAVIALIIYMVALLVTMAAWLLWALIA